MSDSEKLDLLLEKAGNIETEISPLKRQQMKSTAELKAMDEIILDEVERIHKLFEKHKTDTSKHIA